MASAPADGGGRPSLHLVFCGLSSSSTFPRPVAVIAGALGRALHRTPAESQPAIGLAERLASGWDGKRRGDGDSSGGTVPRPVPRFPTPCSYSCFSYSSLLRFRLRRSDLRPCVQDAG